MDHSQLFVGADPVIREAQFNPYNLIQVFGSKRLPVLHSVGIAECGLTCLAMIAIYHGHKTDISTLRSRYPLSINGINLPMLTKIARKLHLQPNAVRLEMEGLKVLKTPCILHWNMNHFVVLKKVTKGYIVIHDPASGVCSHDK